MRLLRNVVTLEKYGTSKRWTLTTNGTKKLRNTNMVNGTKPATNFSLILKLTILKKMELVHFTLCGISQLESQLKQNVIS